MSIRIAAVQLAPQVANLERNVKRAWEIVDTFLGTKKVDLVVLPELALTGYNYSTREHITPFLEPMGSGKSYQFASEVSKKFNCVTVVGYPELTSDDVIYNSAMVVSPAGKVLHNYRKTHLYETDVSWGCSESPDGFTSFDLPIERLGRSLKSCIGICMDLNPYQFTAPFDAYEFATAAAKASAELVIVPTAWMNSAWNEHWTESQVQSFQQCYNAPAVSLEQGDFPGGVSGASILTPAPFPYAQEGKPSALEYAQHMMDPDAATARYWIMRMRPLWDSRANVVICNRSGMEGKLMYAGTSSLISFLGGGVQQHGNRVGIDMDVAGSLAMASEGVLFRELVI